MCLSSRQDFWLCCSSSSNSLSFDCVGDFLVVTSKGRVVVWNHDQLGLSFTSVTELLLFSQFQISSPGLRILSGDHDFSAFLPQPSYLFIYLPTYRPRLLHHMLKKILDRNHSHHQRRLRECGSEMYWLCSWTKAGQFTRPSDDTGSKWILFISRRFPRQQTFYGACWCKHHRNYLAWYIPKQQFVGYVFSPNSKSEKLLRGLRNSHQGSKANQICSTQTDSSSNSDVYPSSGDWSIRSWTSWTQSDLN